MKILFVLESYYPNVGGLETLFTSLVNSLAQNGHRITVITNKPKAIFNKDDSPENIRIRRYNFHNRYIFTLLAFFPALWHGRGHDLIQTTSYNAAIPAFLAGMVLRKKVFITFHEYWGKLWFSLPFFNRFLLWGHYLFERSLIKIPFHKFIAVSQHTSDRLIEAGVSPDKVIRIYNGISYEKWNVANKTIEGRDRRHFRFIYFGRLGISKGLNILIEAVDILNQKGISFEVHLIIPVKPQGLFNHIIQLIAKKKLADVISVYHHLPQKELIERIIEADAVVIPSYNEGFCYTAVESVALGTPVVCTSRGALPEVVSGKYILLKEFGREALATGMQFAIEGKWYESELKYFHLTDTVSNYISLYKECVAPEK